MKGECNAKLAFIAEPHPIFATEWQKGEKRIKQFLVFFLEKLGKNAEGIDKKGEKDECTDGGGTPAKWTPKECRLLSPGKRGSRRGSQHAASESGGTQTEWTITEGTPLAVE